MIGWPRFVSVYAYPEPVDMRRGLNGLMGLVEGSLKRDVGSGDIFLFLNRRRTITKVLLFDGTGFGIYMKRLIEGRFANLWQRHHAGEIVMTTNELALFLEGSAFGARTLSRAVAPAHANIG